jgi:hypothetical protein
MITNLHHREERTSHAMPWFITVAWALILAKCAAIWWAIGYWQVPIHPAWLVVPTLLFAALATMLWVTHRAED